MMTHIADQSNGYEGQNNLRMCRTFKSYLDNRLTDFRWRMARENLKTYNVQNN